MRIIVKMLVLLFLLLPVSSYALDLSSNTLYDNIIESLKSGEKGWFFQGGDLNFANPSDVKELMKQSWPEHDSRTLVVISFSLFFNGGYATMEKPIEQKIPERYEKKIIHQIKVMTLEKLMAEGIKPRGKNKPVKKKDVVKNTPQPEKDGLKKIEATGRKL